MTAVLPSGFDFTDPDVNLIGTPHEEFTALCRTSPIHSVEQTEPARAGMAPEAGTGYWALTRHAEVAAVSKNSKVFSSRENAAIIRNPETATRDSIEMTRVVIINQDAPEHTQTRSIISRGFTPRAISALDDILEERARRIVTKAVNADKNGRGLTDDESDSRECSDCQRSGDPPSRADMSQPGGRQRDGMNV
jgi:cholest-4-en-3-one 26-monooxygenase